MKQFSTKNINETEMVYSLLREKYPKNQIKIVYNDNTKEYILDLTEEEYIQDPSVILDVNIRVIYGDSVTGNTPLLLQKDGQVYIETIENIFDESKKIEYPGFKIFDKTVKLEKEYSITDFKVWTDIGWKEIKKVIRHKTDKKIYRVLTHTGCIDVSEDHSLIRDSYEKVKPNELQLGDILLHDFPTEFLENQEITLTEKEAEVLGMFMCDELEGNVMVEKYGHLFYDKKKDNKIVPNFILNASKKIKKAFFYGYYGSKSENPQLLINEKIVAQGLYYLMKSIGFNICIELYNQKMYKLSCNNVVYKNKNTIKKIIKRSHITTDEFIYDLETDIGRFGGGVGELQLSNTDSIFLEMKYNRDDFVKNRQDTFKLASVCGDIITDTVFNRQPIVLEFEKVFQPFILLTKKRYIGKKYENMKDPFKLKEITKSGIAITRRNYASVVKNCYKEVIDCIVNSGCIEQSIEIYKKYIDRIDAYQIDIEDLVVSAMLAKSYKTRPVHVQLADKLKERKEEVQIGDRLRYIYIENTSGEIKQKSELGEDPDYAKKNGLKYNRGCYLSQLAKPLLGFFRVVLSEHQSELNDIIEYTNEKLIEYKESKLKISDYILED